MAEGDERRPASGDPASGDRASADPGAASAGGRGQAPASYPDAINQAPISVDDTLLSPRTPTKRDPSAASDAPIAGDAHTLIAAPRAASDPLGVGEAATLIAAPGADLSDVATARREPGSSRRTPTRIGRYLVIEPIGEGGMGVVFAAFDPQLDRKVAIKLVRPAYTETSGDEAQARLLREAQALARLRHPNIVTVYEAGAFGDEVYVAMEFVDGVTLRTWQFEHARGWREILRVYQAAGRGLAAAHRAGLVHRDFKPDNVLVTPEGEARVLDFGLAFRDEGAAPAEPRAPSPSILATQLTMTGALVGTPAYMSPEQHRGEVAGVRADVFAFAVSLYEALYSVRPFAGATVPEICASIFAGAITPPPPFIKIPAWLRRVVLRGLRVRPEERPEDMDAFLRALGRDPARYLAVAGVVAVFAVIIGGLVLALKTAEGRQTVRDAGAQVRADFDRARAEALGVDLAIARGGGAKTRYNRWVIAAARERLGASPPRALATLRHLDPDGSGASEARTVAADALARGVPSAAWTTPEAPVAALAFAGDAPWLVTGDARGRLELRAVDGRARPGAAEAGAPITALAAASGSASALRVAAIAGGELVLWEVDADADADADADLRRPLTDAGLLAVALSPDGQQIATGGDDGRLRIRAWEGAELHAYPTHEAPVSALAWSADGRTLASGGADGRVILWTLAADTHRELAAARGAIRALTFDAEGGRLVAVDERARASTWALEGKADARGQGDAAHLRFSGRTTLRVEPDGAVNLDHVSGRRSLASAPARAVDLSASGRWAAIVTAEGVELWDARERRARHLEAAPPRLDALTFAADGRWLAATSGEGGVHLWDVESGARETLRLAGPSIRAAFFDPAGEHLVVADERPSLVAWALADDPRVARELVVSAPGSIAGGAQLLPGGGLAYWGYRADLGISELALLTAAGERRLDLEVGPGLTIVRLVDGERTLVIAPHHGRPRLYAVADGRPARLAIELGDDAHQWRALADADGRARLAAARVDAEGEVEGFVVWELPSRERGSDALPTPYILYEQSGVAEVVADRARAAVAIVGRDRVIRLWHLPSGAIHRLPSCIRGPDDVEVSADLRAAVLVGGGQACVIDLESGAHRLVALSGGPWAWDGRRTLASVHRGGEVDLWRDPVPDDLAALLPWLDAQAAADAPLAPLRRR